jgi:hypothetical protein
MKDISDTVFASSTTTAGELSGATLVFDGTKPASAFIDENWITLSLIGNFVHYPNRSLEIIIETNVGGSGNESQASKGFRHNTTQGKRFQFWQQDNIAPTGAGTLDTLRPNIKITFYHAAPCGGSVSAGTIVLSDTAVCTGTTTELVLQGSSQGVQTQVQWQSSNDGINFTDISGANQGNYTATINAKTFFRVIVSCGATSDTSLVASVNTLLPTYCYCYTSLGGGCSSYSIDSLSIIGTGFHASLTGCENNVAPHYSAYAPGPNYTATLTAGQTYTLTIRQTGSNITSLWIDYNHDGVFGTHEWTQVNTSSVTNGLQYKTFVVDTFALNGLTGMRVRSRSINAGVNDSTCACTGFSTGETEDFMVTITGGGTIGIEDHLLVMDVKVFPNPNKGSFVVETGGKNTAFLVEVSDVLGNVLLSKMEENGDGRINIDLDATPGIYFVRGVNILNRRAFVKKIVIE